MEDDLQWNTTFDGRRPAMEDDLRWKTTFDGRQPLMEDNLKNKYNLKMKKIMFLSLVGLLRQRSDYCHRVAIFIKIIYFTTYGGRVASISIFDGKVNLRSLVKKDIRSREALRIFCDLFGCNVQFLCKLLD